jgi:predicted phage-related endonuclease
MTIDRIPITSEQQWLELRRADVTASVVGALWNLHPYLTLGQLHISKAGVDLPGPDPESAVIRRGNDLEPVVASMVARDYPKWRIRKANEYYRDAKRRIGCTPDFFISDPAREGRGNLQIKTVGSAAYKRHWAEDIPPIWILLQSAVEMMLTQSPWGIIGALEVGEYVWQLHTFHVDRNPAAEQRIIDRVAEFWEKVDAGEQPTIDYERDGELISLLYPREVPGKSIDLTGDNRIGELLEQRETCREAIRITEQQCDRIENEIKAKIGDAETALVNGWRVSFKNVEKKAYSVKTTSYRQLRCKREKDDND